MKCIVILIAKRLTWPTERVRPSGRTHRCVRNQADGGAIEKQAFQSRSYSSKNVFGPLQSIGWRCCISPPGPEVALSQFWQIQKCSILKFWDSGRGSLVVWQSLSYEGSLLLEVWQSASIAAARTRQLLQEFLENSNSSWHLAPRAKSSSKAFTSGRNSHAVHTLRLMNSHPA